MAREDIWNGPTQVAELYVRLSLIIHIKKDVVF